VIEFYRRVIELNHICSVSYAAVNASGKSSTAATTSTQQRDSITREDHVRRNVASSTSFQQHQHQRQQQQQLTVVVFLPSIELRVSSCTV